MNTQEAPTISTPSWLLGYLTQQVLVPIGTLVATWLAVLIFKPVSDTNPRLDWFAAFLFYVIPLASGFVAGTRMGHVPRKWAQPGKAIWYAPVSLLAVAVLPGLIANTDKTLQVYFMIDAKSGNTESGLALILVTLPVAACCAYSAGINFAEHRRTSRQSLIDPGKDDFQS